ncbi:unnamed protein product, partial [Enterobius vermicularis]|uniref:Lipocalin n=1 Tax=Enterobius vermicularis TaxID=51028 RepID=A0A0N4VAX0_ENTVE
RKKKSSIYFQVWLNAKNVPFFNFSVNRCDDSWKLKFTNECQNRNLAQNFYEFQSKQNVLSHVKIRFFNDSNGFEMCPIFDVPAKASGRYYCYSRYFRDF